MLIFQIEYLVRWSGCKLDEDCWEPEENLINARARIDEFNYREYKHVNDHVLDFHERELRFGIQTGPDVLRNVDEVPEPVQEISPDILNGEREMEQLRIEINEMRAEQQSRSLEIQRVREEFRKSRNKCKTFQKRIRKLEQIAQRKSQ